MNDWWIVKKKGEDQIYTVGSISTSSDGTVYVLFDFRGVRYEVKKEIILQDYEEVIPDLEKFIPNLIHYIKVDPNFRKCFQPFARRLDPDYFKLGDVVYFTNTSYFCDEKQSNIFDCIGTENPYTIVNIEQDYKNEMCFWVYIAKGSEAQNTNFTFRLPMYKDRLVPGDVFNCLKRYNKPY